MERGKARESRCDVTSCPPIPSLPVPGGTLPTCVRPGGADEIGLEGQLDVADGDGALAGGRGGVVGGDGGGGGTSLLPQPGHLRQQGRALLTWGRSRKGGGMTFSRKRNGAVNAGGNGTAMEGQEEERERGREREEKRELW